MDGWGEGFNDLTPTSPIGGNTGTTLGRQRLNAFNFAASIWGQSLSSNAEIRVEARMDPQTCEATTATLGSAGPEAFARSFSGAPVADTWYPIALANALFGSELSPQGNDIGVTFNSTLNAGNVDCLGGITW